ncbi:MAG: diphthine--ammonia ligase, partial [Nitrosopumilaceae archaeon]|nr:diphthine--ammonia ligase [Nitrosopumilaceae archaeon]
MKLAALFSGGKDSTYSIFKAKNDGHSIECLITIVPKSDESMLLHYPNIAITKLQASSMNVPQIYVESNSNDTEFATKLVTDSLKKAQENYKIEGLVQGGILSEYQKNNFTKACDSLDLKLISPVWHQEQKKYMQSLLEDGFKFIVTSVSSDGLDDSWLGKEIDFENLVQLERLSKKYGFNLNFE